MKLYPIPPRVGTLAPEHREDAVALLKAAKPRIESGQSGFICNALYAIAKGGDRITFLRLEALIEERLEGHNYASWLLSQRITPVSESLRLARLAWMDDMIEEFSS